MARSQSCQQRGANNDRFVREVAVRQRFPIALVAWLVLIAPLSVVSAAVLTVGDHGTYPEIQDAVDVALGAGSTEIRVERGTYVEHVYVSSSFVSDDITITGGWNTTFTTRSIDASLTVIDGAEVTNQVIGISMTGGVLQLEGFTITNGFAPAGGGLRVGPSGGTVIVSNNRIIGNNASGSLPGGGGVQFRSLTGDSRFFLINNLISGNTAENTSSGSASGGGVMLYAHDESAFEATGNRIVNNTCAASGDTVFGCGVSIYVDSTASSVFSDNVIKGNSSTTGAGTDVQGAGGNIGSGLGRNGNLTMRRNVWIDNRDLGSQEGYHVRATFQHDHALTFSDSVIAGGPKVGLGVWSSNVSLVRLNNLTVFDHAGTGVYINTSASMTTLYNTIVYGSPTPTDFAGGSVSTGGNLLAVDPLFVNPATWDCHLRAGSPALNAGFNAPPGGLGPGDADGNPRVLGGTVDIGAYEGVSPLFDDGFELGNTSGWSVVNP